MLAEKLDKKVQVYKKQEVINDLGQTEYQYNFYKNIWANITPLSNKHINYIAETNKIEHNFKFILRENSIKDLSRDMYFIYKNQKYNVDYFVPNFKNKDRIEIICKLVVN